MRRILGLRWYWRWAVLLGGGIALVAVIGVGVRVLLWPHVTLKGERLTWFDWASLVGVVMAVVGLGATFVQVLHTKSAAEAARSAVDEALAALAKSELLVDFQTMRQLEYELEKSKADKDTVQRLIRELREVGARLETALREADPEDSLIADIEAIRATASQARVVIMADRKNLNLENATKKLRLQLVPTCDKISTRMNELRLDVRGEKNNGKQ